MDAVLNLLAAVALMITGSNGQVTVDLPRVKVPPLKIGAPPAPPELPNCHCAAQCDAAWAVATASVEELSGMRLRLATPSLLETYPANRAGLFGGRVTREPLGNGAYAIRSSFASWTPGDSTESRRLTALLHERVREAVGGESCENKR